MYPNDIWIEWSAPVERNVRAYDQGIKGLHLARHGSIFREIYTIGYFQETGRPYDNFVALNS